MDVLPRFLSESSAFLRVVEDPWAPGPGQVQAAIIRGSSVNKDLVITGCPADEPPSAANYDGHAQAKQTRDLEQLLNRLSSDRIPFPNFLLRFKDRATSTGRRWPLITVLGEEQALDAVFLFVSALQIEEKYFGNQKTED